MNTGKDRRLQRIFRADKKAVVIALDHGLPGMAPLAHLTQPGILLEKLEAAGADAVLTTPGIAARFSQALGRMGLILRLDGAATMLGDSAGGMRLIASVEDALRLGADAVAVMGICGTPDETQSLETLGKVAVECRRLGLPLMAEMLPLGYQGKPDVAQVALAARIGAEMGADLIKTKYVGPREAYRQVAETCYVPVLILGGSARAPQDLVGDIREGLKAGAAGAVIGRNVWQAKDPAAVTRMLVSAVHS